MTFSSKELAAEGVSAEVLEARALRRRLKVSQAEFAAMAGVSESSVRRYELAESKISPVVTLKIQSLVERWRIKPPALEKKVERRGGWNRGEKVSAV
jgi:predicted transcriptional regulator